MKTRTFYELASVSIHSSPSWSCWWPPIYAPEVRIFATKPKRALLVIFFFDSDIRHDVPFFAHFVCKYSEKSQLVTILRVGFFDDIIGMIKDVSIVS